MALRGTPGARRVWRHSTRAFLRIIEQATHAFNVLMAAASQPADQLNAELAMFWDAVLTGIETLLSAPARPSSDTTSEVDEDVIDDDKTSDSAIELEVVQMLRTHMSPSDIVKDASASPTANKSIIPSSRMPRCVAILQRGATHATIASAVVPSSVSPAPHASTAAAQVPTPQHNAALSKACLDALLDPKVAHSTETQSLAHASLIQGCSTTLQAYVSDSEGDQSRLTEARSTELVAVLDTIQAMLRSDHRAAAVQLFPVLVDCVVIASPSLRQRIRDVLKLYSTFLPSTQDHVL